MDQKSADYVIDHTCYLKKTLQFLVPISIISFLVSYFSLLPFIFHQLHFYSTIYPFFAHALDRNCMFLICNGILAFLANNMKLNTSALNYGGYMKRFDDDEEQLPEMVVVLHENAASMEVLDINPTPLEAVVSEELMQLEVQQEQDDEDDEDKDGEGENEMVPVITLGSEEWGDEDEDEEDEDEENEVVVNGGVDDETLVNEMRVSTEELNKKFDEFIRKMKEEIRFEARQQYVVVA